MMVDIPALLSVARAAGLSVRADGDRMAVNGPREAQWIVERLRTNKAEVLRFLSGDQGLLSIKRELRWLDKHSLHVDFSYQRGEVSKEKTLRIAREFEWAAFGALTGGERADGFIYIIDGYQRMLAAKMVSSISAIPVMVGPSAGREEEARIFRLINVNKSPVSAFKKFMAAVTEGKQPEVEIAAWLKTVGLIVERSGSKGDVVDFAHTLVRLWKIDRQASQEAIRCQLLLNQGEALTSVLHGGMWYLLRRGVNVGDYIDKLGREGGKAGCIRSINVLSIGEGSSERSIRMCGLGILWLINKGKKSARRIRINVDDDETGTGGG